MNFKDCWWLTLQSTVDKQLTDTWSVDCRQAGWIDFFTTLHFPFSLPSPPPPPSFCTALTYDLHRTGITSVSVGPKLANSIPRPTTNFKDYLGDSNYPNSFYFDAVTSSEIEMEILSTPSSKTYWLYSRPVRLLKSARHVISSAFSWTNE